MFLQDGDIIVILDVGLGRWAARIPVVDGVLKEALAANARSLVLSPGRRAHTPVTGPPGGLWVPSPRSGSRRGGDRIVVDLPLHLDIFGAAPSHCQRADAKVGRQDESLLATARHVQRRVRVLDGLGEDRPSGYFEQFAVEVKSLVIQQPGIMRMASTIWSSVSSTSMPKVDSSWMVAPRPTPRSTRPPDRMSRVATRSATLTGWL